MHGEPNSTRAGNRPYDARRVEATANAQEVGLREACCGEVLPEDLRKPAASEDQNWKLVIYSRRTQ